MSDSKRDPNSRIKGFPADFTMKKYLQAVERQMFILALEHVHYRGGMPNVSEIARTFDYTPEWVLVKLKKYELRRWFGGQWKRTDNHRFNKDVHRAQVLARRKRKSEATFQKWEERRLKVLAKFIRQGRII